MTEPCRVLITYALAEPLVERIREAGGEAARVEVLSSRARQSYRGVALDDPADAAAARGELDAALREAHVIFNQFRVAADLYERAPKLRWLQVTSAGVERLFASGLINDRIIVTNASGVHSTPIGEWVIGAMLAFAKNLPVLFRAQQKHVWERAAGRELRDTTCGVIGMGAIGAEAARLAAAFGMRVLAIRRSTTDPRTEDSITLLPPSQLTRVLEESDYVVLAVPSTAETCPLIGAKELALMKPGAVLVNIARGDVVDEAALIEALRERRIRGAALDVFTQEPLPSDSPFWDMDNVIISPHVSSSSSRYDERAVDIFADNLRRFLNDEPLRNRVDPVRGY